MNNSYRFRDKRRFQLKIANFPTHPVYLSHPLNGFSLEFGIKARDQKTRIMELPGRERSLTLSSAVWIQYTNVTDGHWPTAKTALIRISLRGKNRIGRSGRHYSAGRCFV